MLRFTKVGLILVLAGAIDTIVSTKLMAADSADVLKGKTTTETKGVPKVLDLGSKSCIPCKMMAPILEELKKDYAGKFDVDFIDVGLRENATEAHRYGIKQIPTQIFFDKDGKELWRHEGFLGKTDILGKWKEFGYKFGGTELPKIERWEPAKKDERSKDQVCYMCDGDINEKTAVVVNTQDGDVRLCSPHCYFIMYSCLTEDKTGFEKKVSVTDCATGKLLPAAEPVYLFGLEERSGRPWVKAFATHDAATTEMKSVGGSIIAWKALQENELSHRCGFCDRCCYPQDVAKVLINGVHSYGCCAHCAMGVAARTGKDIEVHQPDGLTGEMIVVTTLGGKVASVEPQTAVAWFGKKKTADGKWVSAGCFHQGFFQTTDNLKEWLEQNPYETGEIITINQSLANKMKLSPQQIRKACKIGECAPKNAVSQHEVAVYYMHRTFRCRTCLSIEDAAEQIIRNRFSDELASGKLRWQAINYEEHEDLARRYDLSMPSLVLVSYSDGKEMSHQILAKTWDLHDDPDEFESYVVEAVSNRLAKVK